MAACRGVGIVSRGESRERDPAGERRGQAFLAQIAPIPERMMPLPMLVDVPSDPRGWDSWSFQHAADHTEIVQAIKSKKRISVPLYQLWPINFADRQGLERWLELHQQAHDDALGALGIAGEDLGGFDIKDEQKMRSWIYQNFQDHLNMRTTLGI